MFYDDHLEWLELNIYAFSNYSCTVLIFVKINMDEFQTKQYLLFSFLFAELLYLFIYHLKTAGEDSQPAMTALDGLHTIQHSTADQCPQGLSNSPSMSTTVHWAMVPVMVT